MSDLPPPARPTLDDRPRRRWVQPVLVVAILLLVALGAWYYHGRSAAPDSVAAGATTAAGKGGAAGKGRFGAPGKGGRVGFDPNRAQPVTAVPARLGNIDIVQNALGTVIALKTVTVRPRVDGQLQTVTFDEGKLVKAGEVLAQIDPATFQVALEQAEGQLARDSAQLANARIDLNRYQTLLKQDSIAEQQVDQQAALVKQLEGTVKVDQAQVDNARLQLSYTRIVAPTAGRVGLRLVDAGNMVHTNDANGIAVITLVDPITAIFPIPQDALPAVIARLRSGQKLEVEAWDRDQKTLLAKGTVLGADNQIDVATGTVKIKGQFANAAGRLFPNQFVNVRMVVDTLRDVVVVPSAAIQRNADGTLVYLVTDDNTVALRPVQAGASEGQLTAVLSGLKPGERVITDGIDRIREGARVEVVDRNAAPSGGGGPRKGPRNAEPNAPAATSQAPAGEARKGNAGRRLRGEGKTTGDKATP